MIQFLAAPCYLVTGQKLRYRRSVNWLRGIWRGYRGWQE